LRRDDPPPYPSPSRGEGRKGVRRDKKEKHYEEKYFTHFFPYLVARWGLCLSAKERAIKVTFSGNGAS